MNRILRIATRKSRLALWQAEHVAAAIRQAHTGIEVELVALSTRGDEVLNTSLARIGGKGLFTKELERALADGRADLAVHSMKDVPVVLPPGMALAAVMERADPWDAFVSTRFQQLGDLPRGARIGSSSLRRQSQLRHHRPDLQVLTLRGNVETRLQRLTDGEFEAILLAAAGLQRLGLAERITSLLEPEISLPAIGQGTIGIECREDDAKARELLALLNHRPSWQRTLAERALNRGLHGSCESPVAGYAELAGSRLRLRGRVALPDGSRIVDGERSGDAVDAETIGLELARELLTAGADKILAATRT